MMPFVSVIIPTYNRAGFVPKAIGSVLAQTYLNYEIIVIDDGSTDNTRDVLECFGDRIRYYYQTNGGVSTARNQGIRKAQGDLLAFLDSDDEWLPHKLEIQMNDLSRFPEAVLSCTNIQFVGPHSKPVNYYKECSIYEGTCTEFISQPLLKKYAFQSTPTILAKREYVVRAGMFDETLRIYEDIDLWFRLATMGGFVINPAVLAVAYRRDEPDDVNLSAQYLKEKERNYQSLVTVYQKLSRYVRQDDDKKMARSFLSNSIYDLGLFYYHNHKRSQARRCFWDSIRACPTFKNAIKFMLALSGETGIRYIEKKRMEKKGFRRSSQQ